MPLDTAAPVIVERAGRLNEALLAKGCKAVTTTATGGIDIPMLLACLHAAGLVMDISAPDGSGCITATITTIGTAHGPTWFASAARSPSRSTAIVEAAIAALHGGIGWTA